MASTIHRTESRACRLYILFQSYLLSFPISIHGGYKYERQNTSAKSWSAIVQGIAGNTCEVKARLPLICLLLEKSLIPFWTSRHTSAERPEIDSGNCFQGIAWAEITEMSDIMFRSSLNKWQQGNLMNFIK